MASEVGLRDVGHRGRGGPGGDLRGDPRGKRIGLANKEVLVSSGKLVIDAARKSGTELIPVDSEHNGAHQCLGPANAAKWRG